MLTLPPCCRKNVATADSGGMFGEIVAARTAEARGAALEKMQERLISSLSDAIQHAPAVVLRALGWFGECMLGTVCAYTRTNSRDDRRVCNG